MLKPFNGHQPHIHPETFIFETTVIIGRVELARGVSVWPGCVLRGDVERIAVGEDTNLQDGVLVHVNHDMPAVIGRGTTVGHGAIIHGCRIGDNCLVGMGATILDGAVVESDCIIGAGALVTKSTVIPRGSLVLGVPGRVTRQLTAAEIEKNRRSAEEYVLLAQTYAAGTHP
jgi:carbonic anhydrase/acetyltransferase-like protein (isoleucine patch superfamily)